MVARWQGGAGARERPRVALLPPGLLSSLPQPGRMRRNRPPHARGGECIDLPRARVTTYAGAEAIQALVRQVIAAHTAKRRRQRTRPRRIPRLRSERLHLRDGFRRRRSASRHDRATPVRRAASWRDPPATSPGPRDLERHGERSRTVHAHAIVGGPRPPAASSGLLVAAPADTVDFDQLFFLCGSAEIELEPAPLSRSPCCASS